MGDNLWTSKLGKLLGGFHLCLNRIHFVTAICLSVTISGVLGHHMDVCIKAGSCFHALAGASHIFGFSWDFETRYFAGSSGKSFSQSEADQICNAHSDTRLLSSEVNSAQRSHIL